MNKLGTHPEIVRLAGQLGLSRHGDCLPRIREHAHKRIESLLKGWPVTTFESFLRLVAGALSVQLEFIRDDKDIDELASKYKTLSPAIREQLIAEFRRGETEGYLVQHQNPLPGDRRFVAFVDARGPRARRAYFTAWHEITHLMILPPQLAFPGFRRVLPAELRKDPLESVVDLITGELAFHQPIFLPVLQEEMERAGRLTFDCIERARARATPEASLFAAALASVRLCDTATCLVRVERGFKKAERRRLSSPQIDLGPEWEPENPEAKLRLVEVVPNEAAKSQLRIFKNMRVPPKSVLRRAYDSQQDTELQAIEDQSWWETSGDGRLPAVPILVEVVRKGRYVYGLLSPQRDA